MSVLEAIAQQRQSAKYRIFQIIKNWKIDISIRMLIILLFMAISIFPFFYMLSLSFQPVGDILTFPPVLIPNKPTAVNYIQAWQENDFATYFINSMIVSFGTVIGTLIFSVLTAYGFARYKFRGREFLFYLFLASLVVPGILLVIPQYLLMKDFGLLNSRRGLVLLYISSNLAFSIFLLRSFFESVPKELEEAMRMDGVSELGILFRLILPLSMSSLATVAIFTFNGAWDEVVLAYTMITSAGKRTLPMGLALFLGEHTLAWGQFFAASVIATLPIVLVFIVSQKWFQQGISIGAFK